MGSNRSFLNPVREAPQALSVWGLCTRNRSSGDKSFFPTCELASIYRLAPTYKLAPTCKF
jgi:hypothetical protein